MNDGIFYRRGCWSSDWCAGYGPVVCDACKGLGQILETGGIVGGGMNYNITINRDLKGSPCRLSFMSPTEHQIQSAFFEWIDLHKGKWPWLHLFYAIPNGGKRHIATAKRLKAEGQKAGVPDCHLPVPGNLGLGLWIEFKAGRNRPTKEQLAYHVDLQTIGHHVAVCRSWVEAAEITMRHLGMPERMKPCGGK